MFGGVFTRGGCRERPSAPGFVVKASARIFRCEETGLSLQHDSLQNSRRGFSPIDADHTGAEKTLLLFYESPLRVKPLAEEAYEAGVRGQSP